MYRIDRVKTMIVTLALFVVTSTAAHAQGFQTLLNFDGTNGAFANQLVQGLDGNMYGTTQSGGAGGKGTIFSMTPTGQLTTLFSFCAFTGHCLDGAQPITRLVLGDSNYFYGTTWEGGTNDLCCSGGGTLFRITPDGKLTTIYSFCAQANCADGSRPQGVTWGFSGQLFGVANGGGASYGGIFKISGPNPTFTTYSFCQSGPPCANGETPQDTLIQASDGSFYGTTSGGGAKNYGTIFRVTPSGKITTLYSFCSKPNCADGANPKRGLVEGTDGNLYGVTPYGGVGANCSSGNCGTVFRFSRSGGLKTLYSFCAQPNCADGNVPEGGLLQATDGNFYGTTALGGTNYGAGTVFRITPSGALTTIYNFCAVSPCSDGSSPTTTLMQHTNGNVYGATYGGGAHSVGVIFSLALGLPAFIEASPYGASSGKTVKILGQGLTGTTSVVFNGTAAMFRVQSDTYLTATVPSAATSGYLTVTTPTGILTSNLPFSVIP